VLITWRGLRVQSVRPVVDGVKRPNRCLADFIAPRARASTTTSACSRSPPGSASRKKERSSPPTSTTTARSCSRRSPIASPRRSPRACTGASAPTSGATARRGAVVADLVAERYRGIRPAPGYPALPRPPRQARPVPVLGCDVIGMSLTESLAMLPRRASRLLLRASRRGLLQRRQDRARPGARLGAAQRVGRKRRRAGIDHAALVRSFRAPFVRSRTGPGGMRLITSGASPCNTRRTRIASVATARKPSVNCQVLTLTWV
jgi:hypothetical protein